MLRPPLNASEVWGAAIAGGFSVIVRSLSAQFIVLFFFFNDPGPTEISPLSLPDALPIWLSAAIISSVRRPAVFTADSMENQYAMRSEEHTSELQSLRHLVCRLLLEK